MTDDAPFGRIFISYRHADTPATAGRVNDRLKARFGFGSVFMDVYSIALGRDFVRVITTAVGSCDVVLAVIGAGWLDASDERGRRRLDDPEDFVVLEIAAGLERDIPVVPVLVDGVGLPREDDLPARLAPLARRQALRLDHETFDTDLTRLITALEGALAVPTGAGSSDLAPPSRLVQTLVRHLAPVSTVAFSADGRSLASACMVAACLWDPRDGRLLQTVRGHPNLLTDMALAPDADKLATVDMDGACRLWDPVTGVHLRTLEGHSEQFSTVAFSSDGRLLATGSSDRSTWLWDADSGDHLRTLDSGLAGVLAMAFSPAADLLAVANSTPTGNVWLGDPRTGEHVRTLTGHPKSVNALAFSPDGTLLATGGADRVIILWDLATGWHVRILAVKRSTFGPPQAKVRAVAFRPDGRLLASGSSDKIVRLWDPATGELLGSLEGHGGMAFRGVNDVAFSPDGQVLASAGDDRTVRLWK